MALVWSFVWDLCRHEIRVWWWCDDLITRVVVVSELCMYFSKVTIQNVIILQCNFIDRAHNALCTVILCSSVLSHKYFHVPTRWSHLCEHAFKECWQTDLLSDWLIDWICLHHTASYLSVWIESSQTLLVYSVKCCAKLNSHKVCILLCTYQVYRHLLFGRLLASKWQLCFSQTLVTILSVKCLCRLEVEAMEQCSRWLRSGTGHWTGKP